MGTNYYHKTLDSKRHIGKSSAGWCFSLHVYPEIPSLEMWEEKFKTGEIVDEYGTTIPPAKMSEIIRERSWNKARKYYLYTSEADFMDKNFAEPGPNNLVRSKVDGRHCIGHGEGTWDLVIGDFS